MISDRAQNPFLQEALIANGVLNREINKAGGKFVPGVSDYDNETSLGKFTHFVPISRTNCTMLGIS